jgi:hypothetical protein
MFLQKKPLYILAVVLLLSSCSSNNKEKPSAKAITAKEAVFLNQLIYKDSLPQRLSTFTNDYTMVFAPQVVNSNYAVILKKKNAEQYALVIRGSVLEFSNDGFQNFIIQDFNVFTMKAWNYTDTVKGAYISKGAAIGFDNLLQLKDSATGLSIKSFIEKNIPSNASLLITGHSLGGNLGYVMASYLHKELTKDKRSILQLITYGAPAVGNAAFIKDIEEKFPTAERFAIDKDIATVFPDASKIKDMGKIVGLDSALKIGTLGINGVIKDLNVGDLLNTVTDVLERTNILNESNKYVQSQKHLKTLPCSIAKNAPSISVEAIFNNAYQYHSINKYAELLGVNTIK